MPVRLLITPGLLLLWATMAAGQTFPSPPPVSEFNVEITNLMPTKYVDSVPAAGKHGGVYANGHLRLAPDWKPSGDIPSAASILKAEFWLEQDSLRLEVQAYFGEIPPNSRPPDWEQLRKIKIASRLVRVDETVTLDEIRQVGIEPFQIKMARSDPWSVGPPEIVNKTQALNVEETTEQRPVYTVTVRNVSTKNVIAIQWSSTVNDRPAGGASQRSARLIPAGKLFQIRQHFSPTTEQRSNESAAQLPRRRQIVITAILFEDGTFEGDVDAAAGMAASSLGESVQISRVLPLLEAAATSDQEPAAILAKLKADVEALGENADPAPLSKLATAFAGLSEEMRQRKLSTQLNAGMRFAKSSLLNDIQRFEFTQARGGGKDVRSWLTETIARYRKNRSPYQ